MRILSIALFTASLFSFAACHAPGPHPKVAAFEGYIEEMVHGLGYEVADDAVKLSKDPDVLAHFNNTDLFMNTLSFFCDNYGRRMPATIKQSIKLMLGCPKLDLSDIKVDLLIKAHASLQSDFPALLDHVKPSDRLFTGLTVGKVLLSKYFGQVHDEAWVGVLNKVLTRPSKYHRQMHLLLDDLLRPLISSTAGLEAKLGLAKTLRYPNAVKFLEPILRILVVIQASPVFYKEHGVPTDVTLDIIRTLIAFEFPRE